MSILRQSSAENQHQNTGKNTVGISDTELQQQESNCKVFSSELKQEKEIQQSKQNQEADELKKILLDSNKLVMLPEDTLKILVNMYTEDQQTRLSGDWTKACIADFKNQKIMGMLLPTLEKYDWNKEYALGEKKWTLETVIRLVIQHADNNPWLQKDFLQKYENRLTSSHKAYLEDRVGVNTKSWQVYATQWYNEWKKWYFKTIIGVDTSNKIIYKTDNGHSYIELTGDDIAHIDKMRNDAQIWWSTTEYYNSMSSKVSSQSDGTIKMLIDYYPETIILNPTIFDQNKQVWWRKYSEWNYRNFLASNWKNITWFQQAIQVMTDYLENYSFEEWFNGQMDRRWIEFHLWQQYAMIWDYTNALKWFTTLQHEETVLSEWGIRKHGKEYIDATIAFLQRDKTKIDKIYSTSHLLESEGDKEFIKRLHTHFDKSYIEAYNDWLSLPEQSRFLESQG